MPDRPNPRFADAWFARQGWAAFDFQREVWQAMAEGRSGLLHATTGSGKTLAAWIGALGRHAERRPGANAAPLSMLWLTPMRALAADTARALRVPLDGEAPLLQGVDVALRTGDTPTAERARQDRRLPAALVTTPESLTLMLTRADAQERLCGVHTVVVDEWHELLAGKRGVQVQLALARLRRWCPGLVVWGLSATLGNLDEALAALLRPGEAGAVVRGRMDKHLRIDTLLPAEPGQFSWAGHLGAQMQQPVVDEIAAGGAEAGSTLVFTNVRSQAEAWYQLLLAARPDWAGEVALHHGSLSREVRDWVEAGLKDGRLRAVVATSSLDLGVDFLPVGRVLQIGSAKGVARLLQRAGRSGHAPGRASRVTLVPTHTLELVEAVAARRAALAGRVEARTPPQHPLDVLVQHLVTLALGGGYAADPRPAGAGGWTSDEIFDEVRGAYSFRALTREAFDWALDFVTRGGASLGAYPEHHRVVRDEATGRFGVPDRGIATRHRLSVGTIVGESSMQVKWLTGGSLGTVEEGFIARLKAGDCFVFAGRLLEYVRTREMTAYVRRATKKRGIVPAWSGGRMPLSTELADATLQVLADAATGSLDEPELRAAAPMLAAQQRLSRLPTPDTLLVEAWVSREGHHLYLYPFAGRNVHLGLASLLAWRLSQARPNTWSISVNDYGFELMAAEAPDLAPLREGRVFDTDGLLDDVLASLDRSALAQRRFREIARVAGLVHTGHPGAPRSTRQLQASSSLFYEVFRRYDAGNLLLAQAEQEVLSQELEIGRLTQALQRLRERTLVWVDLPSPSPFSLPLLVERLRDELSTERLADRLARLLEQAYRGLQAAADGGMSAPAQSAP